MSTSTPPIPEINAPTTTVVEAKPLSEGARLSNVFAAPSKTYIDLRRNASWWVPYLLVVAIAYLFAFTIMNKVGLEQLTESGIKQNSRAAQQYEQASPEQKQLMIQRGVIFGKAITYAQPITILIVMVIFAAVLMATFNFGVGAELTFKQCLAAIAYAGVVGAVKPLLGAITLFAGANTENFNPRNFVGTSLAYYLDQATTAKPLYALAGWVDIITIWQFVVLGIGFSALTGKKSSTGLGVMFGWFALLVLGSMALSILF